MANKLYKFQTGIRSSKASITSIEPMLNNIRNEIGLPDETYYNILVAITEAVNNAINHGNKLDENKTVEIKIEATVNTIDISVKDQGEGFEIDKLDDPRTPENLLKSSGRGVFIIKTLANDSSFVHDGKGMNVCMQFSYKPK